MNKRIILSAICAVLLLVLSVTAFAADLYTELEVLGVLGIMNGDENGNLNLDKAVTRAEFSKMTVKASSFKDRIPTDSISSGFTDVEPTHWAAPYIRLAAENKWIYGYGNGSFRPSNNIKLEEAVTVILRMLGYTENDISGVYPSGQLALCESLELDENVKAVKGESITREDCAHLIYNLLGAKTKTGQAYAQTIGYSLDSNGEVDLLKIINDDIKGPFVVKTKYSALGLPTDVRVLYNDTESALSEIKKYDVVYYSSLTKTVTVYSRAVSGTLEAILPNRDTPLQVTVAGKSYQLSGTDAMRSVSSLGNFKAGDLVTLILGRNSEVAAIVSTKEYARDVYGVVMGISQKIYTDENGRSYSARTVDLTLTTGDSLSIKSNKTGFAKGDIVKLTYSDTADVSAVKEKTISGRVGDGMIGERAVSPDVNVLELGYDEENPAPLFFSRLTGAELDKRDVKHFVTDSSGRITDMILGDFSGDACEYGIMLNFTDAAGYVSDEEDFDYSELESSNYVYEYQIGTKKTMLKALTCYIYGGEGPCVFKYNKGKLEDIDTLIKVKNVDAYASFGAVVGDEVWLYSDSVTVYTPSTDKKSELDYDVMSLSYLLENKDGYDITAYADDTTDNGGRIRVIIANKK